MRFTTHRSRFQAMRRRLDSIVSNLRHWASEATSLTLKVNTYPALTFEYAAAKLGRIRETNISLGYNPCISGISTHPRITWLKLVSSSLLAWASSSIAAIFSINHAQKHKFSLVTPGIIGRRFFQQPHYDRIGWRRYQIICAIEQIPNPYRLPDSWP